MAEFGEEPEDSADDPVDPPPSDPLTRDPPPPPGYVNPVEESELLEKPLAIEEPE